MAKEIVCPQVVVDGNDVYVVFKDASKELQKQIKDIFSTDALKQLKTLVPKEDTTDKVVEETRKATQKKTDDKDVDISSIMTMSRNEALCWLGEHVDFLTSKEPYELKCVVAAFQSSKGNTTGAKSVTGIADADFLKGYEKNKMHQKIEAHLRDNALLVQGLMDAKETFPAEQSISEDWN